MNHFYLVSKCPISDSWLLPTRGTAHAAGYDFYVAEDIVIPSIYDIPEPVATADSVVKSTYTLEEIGKLYKDNRYKPTLVPTGVKCELDPGYYLELSVRSSTPLKYWLILANGVGIIDGDYYNNSDNEGHIFFQLINLGPCAIKLKKGDKIGQGIIKKYEVVDGDAYGKGIVRSGGFGSTTQSFSENKVLLDQIKKGEGLSPSPQRSFKDPDLERIKAGLGLPPI